MEKKDKALNTSIAGVEDDSSITLLEDFVGRSFGMRFKRLVIISLLAILLPSCGDSEKCMAVIADNDAGPYGCGGRCKQQTICGVDVLCFVYIDPGCRCPDAPPDEFCCPLEIMDLAEGQTLDTSYDDDPDQPGMQLRVRVDATCWTEYHVGSYLDEVWIGKCSENRDLAGYHRIPDGGICEEVVDLGEDSGCQQICTEIIGGGTSDQVEVCLP